MKVKVNNILNNIKTFIINNKLFIIFILLSVLLPTTLNLLTIGVVGHVKSIISNILVALIIGSFSYVMKPNYRYYYLLIFLAFNCVLAMGNSIYYDFYQSFISISLIDTSSMVKQVNDSVWAKLHIQQFVYLIFPIVFMIVHIYFKKKDYSDKNDNNKKVFKNILLVSFAIFAFLALTMSKADSSRFLKLWNREAVVRKYGLYVYTINDLLQSASPKLNTLFGYDEAAYQFREYYSCRKEDNSINEYTNIFKDKNVIFIHTESLQNFLIDLKINGKYVTPNINKLAHEGIYFKRFYPQISVGTSSDTEFTLNTGLMPSSSGTVFVNYYDRTYKAMPNYFRNMGYYTFSMHANDRNYWNRAPMHKNLGYMDFIAKDNLEIPEDIESKDIVGLGLSDKAFYKQIVPMLKNIKESHEKYLGTIITLSNHSPFNDLEKYSKFDVTMDYTLVDDDGNKLKLNAPYLEDSAMGNYIRSSHYADEAMGELFKLLKDNGLYENTIFVLYGDHEARLAKKEFDLLYNYDPENDNIKSSDSEDYYDVYGYNYDLLKNTPLIIWSGEEKFNKEIENVMGMYDILPTIANMFGFKENYSLGHDIFSNNEKIVVFPNGNVITDKVFYSVMNEEYISFTNEPIEIDYIERLNNYADKILNVSNGIIVYDLIKREESKIGECTSE